VVVERCVAPRNGLQAVVKIEHDLIERELVGDHHARLAHVLDVFLTSAFFFDELEDAAEVLLVGEDLGLNHGLFDLLDVARVRPARRIVDRENLAVRQGDLVLHAGGGGNEVEVVLALEALLDNLEVQQAEEAAAESEAERDGGFGFEVEARIVEAQLFERITQQRVLVRIHGVQASEDHALDVFKAGQSFGCGAVDRGDRVSYLRVGNVFDRRNEEADLAGRELFEFHGLGRHDTHRFDVKHFAVRHQADLLAFAHAAVHDAREHNDAAIRVEPRIEDERLKWS